MYVLKLFSPDISCQFLLLFENSYYVSTKKNSALGYTFTTMQESIADAARDESIM